MCFWVGLNSAISKSLLKIDQQFVNAVIIHHFKDLAGSLYIPLLFQFFTIVFISDVKTLARSLLYEKAITLKKSHSITFVYNQRYFMPAVAVIASNSVCKFALMEKI